MSAIAVSCSSGNATRPKILLRNGWQSQNIGDIGHYLGMFELLDRYGIAEKADIVLWPVDVKNGASDLIAREFPWVTVLRTREEKDRAIAECSFMLHGSANSLSARQDVETWISTGKPFGVFGISLNSVDPAVTAILNKAEFVFFRETVSLESAKDGGCTAPVMEFGPDTTFGMTRCRNDDAALAFMEEVGLEDGMFLCCIPRYRRTPYWLLPGDSRPFNAEFQAKNDLMKEHDHAPLRDAIVAIVRETPMKVLVTCEDMTQIDLGRETLIDPLPADVKANVVWRDRYWLPDEALSVYVRSAGLFGNEMHSPIMCIANGVPAVVCTFKEQGAKSHMWRDIGLDDWLFDLDRPADIPRIVPTVLSIAKNSVEARAKADEARKFVREVQDENFGVLADVTGQLTVPEIESTGSSG